MYLACKTARVQQNWTSWVVKLTHTLLPTHFVFYTKLQYLDMV